jgi:hypothetical protein
LSRRATLLILAVSAALIGATRLLSPATPPLYDGIQLPQPPYNYVSPPPEMASTNKLPSGGEATIAVENGVNKISTVQTADKQVVVVIPKGALVTAGLTAVRVKITPVASPPPPPSHAKYAGNDYLITATGVPGDAPVAFVLPVADHAGQVLMIVPPLAYNFVKMRYDGSWHDLQWQANPNLVFASIDHFGDVAAFEDTSKTPGKKPAAFNPAGLIQAIAVAVALVVIVGAIVVRRRPAKGSKPAKRTR